MPVQGKSLDGRPFEDLALSDRDTFIVRYHPRVQEERQVPRDFDQIWHQDRRERGAFGQDRDEEIFLGRWLFFEKDHKDDEEWGPVRLLGKGGYGTVGLWQKRDNKNQIVDEVVCKETKYDENRTDVEAIEANHQIYPRLLREAAIHENINTDHPGVSPHLREYKFIWDDRLGQRGRYRFYLEYCPHGSLYHLGRLYRCWDTYLPEVFVWHVFYSLAKACEALRDPPLIDNKAIQEEYLMEVRAEELFCLHLDWKPENVLLGYPHEDEDYPSALLNDYGISMYTACSENLRTWNPGWMWWRGTRSHKAPEQSHYGVNWEIPPDGGWVRNQDASNRNLDWDRAAYLREEENEQPGADVLFDHSINIYGLGHTMFDLVTLRASPKHLLKIRAKSVARFQRNGNHQISHVYTKKPGVYSSRLRHLIHRCLDPDPANRPSQLELMDQTRRGLRLAIKRAKRDGKFPVKVYYRDHEINDMPLGDAGFQPSRKEYIDLIHSEFVDPDAPKLKLPAEKYGGFPADWSIPSWKKMYSQRNPHDRWFNGLEGHGNASPTSSQVVNNGSDGSDDDDDDDDDDDENDNDDGGRGDGRAIQGGGTAGPSTGRSNVNENPGSQNRTQQQPPPSPSNQSVRIKSEPRSRSSRRRRDTASSGHNQAGDNVAPRSDKKAKRVRFAVQNGNLAVA